MAVKNIYSPFGNYIKIAAAIAETLWVRTNVRKIKVQLLVKFSARIFNPTERVSDMKQELLIKLRQWFGNGFE